MVLMLTNKTFCISSSSSHWILMEKKICISIIYIFLWFQLCLYSWQNFPKLLLLSELSRSNLPSSKLNVLFLLRVAPLKDAFYLTKATQIIFIALLLPIYFPLWHIFYLVFITAIFPCCHLTHSSLFALLNASMLIPSECPHCQLASSLKISCDQLSHLSAWIFGDFSQHLFRPYQSLSHNEQQLGKWWAGFTQWLMLLYACLFSLWESQGPPPFILRALAVPAMAYGKTRLNFQYQGLSSFSLTAFPYRLWQYATINDSINTHVWYRMHHT